MALAADLLFAARIRAAAQAAGANLTLARSAEDVMAAVRAGASLVILDLDARALDVPALIRRVREAGEAGERAPHVVAFVSHVRADAVEAARAAGADRVLARSAFVRELPNLVAGRTRM